MLTRTRFRDAFQSLEVQTLKVQKPKEIKKGDVVLRQGVQKIVMARLQADGENPVTYSICDDDLRNPQFGIHLEGAEVIPTDSLSETIRRRAQNFA